MPLKEELKALQARLESGSAERSLQPDRPKVNDSALQITADADARRRCGAGRRWHQSHLPCFNLDMRTPTMTNPPSPTCRTAPNSRPLTMQGLRGRVVLV